MKTPHYAADPRWWPSVAEALPKPWPEAACLHDLRWWEDQVWADREERIPGFKRLAKRWGCTHYQARKLMRAEDRWRDPGVDKKKASHPERTPVAPRSHPERTFPASNPPESREGSHPERTPVAPRSHPRRDTRVDTQQHSTQHTAHKEDPSPAVRSRPKPPGGYSRAAWDEAGRMLLVLRRVRLELHAEHTGGRANPNWRANPGKATQALQQRLARFAAELRDDDPDVQPLAVVEQVGRWVYLGPDAYWRERAAGLEEVFGGKAGDPLARMARAQAAIRWSENGERQRQRAPRNGWEALAEWAKTSPGEA